MKMPDKLESLAFPPDDKPPVMGYLKGWYSIEELQEIIKYIQQEKEIQSHVERVRASV